MSALHELSVREAAARVRRREASSVELTEADVERVAHEATTRFMKAYAA